MIEAFLRDGTRRAFGPTLHVEADALMLHGWWHAALRVKPGVFAVRNEPPREEAPALEDLMVSLRDFGLSQVAVDHPLIQPITYTEISLGQVSWALWATDLATGQAALEERAGAETFFSDTALLEPEEPVSADFSAELGGARRVAGLPAALVLTVGVDDERAQELHAALADCRLESRTFAEFPPSSCGALIPGVVVVDATERTGLEFIMELRTEACGRFIPIAAVTDGDVPLGADATLDPRVGPGGWVEPLRALLP